MNRFAEIKQYKHKMLQYRFLFFFYFWGIYMSFNKSKSKKCIVNKIETNPSQIMNRVKSRVSF